MVVTQRPNAMKTKVIISAIAAMAMMMPGIAEARNNHRPVDMGKHRTEVRLAHNHRSVAHRPVAHLSHRPAMGTRFDRRPVHGRFVKVDRERLWLANGVLYRVLPARHGHVYVVVGYIK